ncbi:MAG: FAD:protein FMN transferase, partial [Bifidobacteriaceae bacterium]|nr:FAD:protein FMN transferase [Bifidobacteriaceae bacterium]
QPGHIVDPRTGRPCDAGVAQATVLAASAAEAEAYSTAAVVGGAAWAARRAPAAIIVTSQAVLVGPEARASVQIASR